MIASTYKLRDIAEVIAGQSPPSSTYNTQGIGLPFFQGKADFGKVNPKVRVWCNSPQKIAIPGDILISVRAPVGPTNICDQKACIGRGLSAIRVSDKVKTEYLFAYLRANENKISDLGKGSTFKAITQKDLQNLSIPVPPIVDQVKFIKTYNQSNEIIEKRKQTIDILDQYLSSIFLEMFGDISLNSMDWNKSPLADVIEIRSGQVDPKISPYSEMIHIGSADIESNTGKIVNKITAAEAKQISGKFLFNNEYILYSKIRPYLNKVAIPDFNGISSADIYPIRPKSHLNKYFLAYVLRSQDFITFANGNSSRTNIPKINRQDLLRYLIVVPPINLQNAFAEIVVKQELVKQKMLMQLGVMESHFHSLTQKKFSQSNNSYGNANEESFSVQ